MRDLRKFQKDYAEDQTDEFAPVVDYESTVNNSVILYLVKVCPRILLLLRAILIYYKNIAVLLDILI